MRVANGLLVCATIASSALLLLSGQSAAQVPIKRPEISKPTLESSQPSNQLNRSIVDTCKGVLGNVLPSLKPFAEHLTKQKSNLARGANGALLNPVNVVYAYFNFNFDNGPRDNVSTVPPSYLCKQLSGSYIFYYISDCKLLYVPIMPFSSATKDSRLSQLDCPRVPYEVSLDLVTGKLSFRDTRGFLIASTTLKEVASGLFVGASTGGFSMTVELLRRTIEP